MMAKGTQHNNGVKLAHYLTHGKTGERAELWQLCGFAAADIKDAFRDVQIMSEATRAEQPFFHVQVRNPAGEELNRDQWERIANRIESKLGLTGQPRAIAFHIEDASGHEHMHVAWSRIDEENLTAKRLPFYKLRLKEVSRELEIELGLTRVPNEREGPIKYAPTRAEEEQARRMGFGIHEVRNIIRGCYDRSDCGRSFEAALTNEGLILARGERRDFVVIDQAGSMHALGKRILDVTAAETRARLSDLVRDELPTVEMARTLVTGRDKDPVRRLEQELAEVSKAIADIREQGRWQDGKAPVWDRDQADQTWQDAVINAAIEKEKVERQFVEPKDRQADADSREKKWPIMPPVPEPNKTAARYHFEDAAREAASNRSYALPKELKGMARQIMSFLATLRNEPDLLETKTRTLSAFLDEKGISLAQVTKEEADRSNRDAEFSKAVGRYAQRFKEGEIVAVTEPRPEYRRNGEIIVPGRIHKLDQLAAEEFVASLDKRTQLQGIDATREASDQRVQQRSADWQAIRLEWATKYRDGSRKVGNENAKSPAPALGKSTVRTIGKLFDVAAGAFESLIAPTLTPEQVHDGQKAVHRREAEAEHTIDFSSYTAEMAQQRQQQEQEREAARQRERGGRER
jgi:hypothetical protein